MLRLDVAPRIITMWNVRQVAGRWRRETQRCLEMKEEGLVAHARPLGIVASSKEVDCPMEGYWPQGQCCVGKMLLCMRLWTR